MTWKPIDTAPKDGTRILAWTHADQIEIIDWYELRHPKFTEVDGGLFRREMDKTYDGWNCEGQPIMWMPLPEPPKLP